MGSQDLFQCSRLIAHVRHHAANIKCPNRLAALNLQFLILVELPNTLLEESVLHGAVRMGIEQDGTSVLTVPHQDGIVHQAELVSHSIKGISNLTVVCNLLKESLVAIVR